MPKTSTAAAGKLDRECEIGPAGRRGLLVPLLVGLLCAASLAYGGFAWLTRLPEPEDCDRDQLFRWLVTRDMAAEPDELRQRLIRRFEQELDVGIDIAGVDGQLDPQYRAAFWKNVDLLSRLWCEGQVERFFEVPLAERGPFLDRRIEQVQRWGIVEVFANRGEDGGRKLSAADALLARVQPWIDAAEPEKKQKMQIVVGAVKTRMLFNGLKKLLPWKM